MYYRAQQNAARMGQKTISANHTFAALEGIGFGEFVEPLKSRLERTIFFNCLSFEAL